jgi:riboflavin kinase/FMN adenylyltransferase
MPLRQRVEHMHGVGADYVFVQSFTETYARQDAEAFVPALMKSFPRLRSIHVGENFRFGAGRSGDITTLRESAAPMGVELHALERKILHGVAISSSRIRAALMEGAIDEVNAMLGDPYTAEGRIRPGKGIGREIGFPTLNLSWSPEVLPRFGVYRAYVLPEKSDKRIPAVANYGVRPTVDTASEPLLEVHLLEDAFQPAAGDILRVQFLQYLRPEKAFDSLAQLGDQIKQDVDAANKAFSAGGQPT